MIIIEALIHPAEGPIADLIRNEKVSDVKLARGSVLPLAQSVLAILLVVVYLLGSEVAILIVVLKVGI